MNVKRKGLGKGLDALLGLNEEELDSQETGQAVTETGLKELPIEWLARGRYQPRQDINSEALEELANSIREQGIMQPILVRELSRDSYEIVAGERRWRAAQIVGLSTVPVIEK